MTITVLPVPEFVNLRNAVLHHGKPEYHVDNGDLENGPGEVEYLQHTWGHLSADRSDSNTVMGRDEIFCTEETRGAAKEITRELAVFA